MFYPNLGASAISHRGICDDHIYLNIAMAACVALVFASHNDIDDNDDSFAPGSSCYRVVSVFREEVVILDLCVDVRCDDDATSWKQQDLRKRAGPSNR